jgi:hypothetical protein
LLAAVRPMLATSNGTLIALSTPAGKRGLFYEVWIGDESWHRTQVAADQCPRITKEFLAEELRELGAQSEHASWAHFRIVSPVSTSPQLACDGSGDPD